MFVVCVSDVFPYLIAYPLNSVVNNLNSATPICDTLLRVNAKGYRNLGKSQCLVNPIKVELFE